MEHLEVTTTLQENSVRLIETVLFTLVAFDRNPDSHDGTHLLKFRATIAPDWDAEQPLPASKKHFGYDYHPAAKIRCVLRSNTARVSLRIDSPSQ